MTLWSRFRSLHWGLQVAVVVALVVVYPLTFIALPVVAYLGLKQKPRAFRLAAAVVALVPVFIFVALTNVHDSDDIKKQLDEMDRQQHGTELLVQKSVTSSSSRSRVPAVFDISSLIGKNITQVKAALGKPIDDVTMNDHVHYMTFSKNGQELSANYDRKTGKVLFLFFDADDGSGQKQSRELLLDRGNLSESDSRYKIEVMETGFKILSVESAQAEADTQKKYEEAERYFTQVETCAQQQVKFLLKAPSAAKFPRLSEFHMNYDLNGDKYNVASYVDAQNSYGAMIRSNFVCTVIYDPKFGNCNASCKLLE